MSEEEIEKELESLHQLMFSWDELARAYIANQGKLTAVEAEAQRVRAALQLALNYMEDCGESAGNSQIIEQIRAALAPAEPERTREKS